MNINFNKNN